MNAPGHGYSLDFIQSMLSAPSGPASGWFQDLELKTVFQPVFSFTHRRSIGFDAAVRSTGPGGKPVPAERLFGPVHNFSETSLLDLLCITMHVQNYLAAKYPRPGLLFINLHPDVFLDSQRTAAYFAALLHHYRISPSRLALDIPGSVLQSDQLLTALNDYKRLGCPIAIDDFGVDNRNLDTVWDSSPILVKVAPYVMAAAVGDQSVRQSLQHAVSLLHEMGTLVLMEGIETEMQALLALDADADFASGFYLGGQVEDLGSYDESPNTLDSLWRTYKQRREISPSSGTQQRTSLQDSILRSSQIGKLEGGSKEEIRRYREIRRPFITAAEQAVSAVIGGEPLNAASRKFLALPGAIRAYLLNADGKYLGPDAPAPHLPIAKGFNFHSLATPSEPDWSRRDFFRRARREPDVVQVTRKYCSLAGYVDCVTFSIAFSLQGKPVVWCGDVDWSHQKQ